MPSTVFMFDIALLSEVKTNLSFVNKQIQDSKVLNITLRFYTKLKFFISLNFFLSTLEMISCGQDGFQ